MNESNVVGEVEIEENQLIDELIFTEFEIKQALDNQIIILNRDGSLTINKEIIINDKNYRGEEIYQYISDRGNYYAPWDTMWAEIYYHYYKSPNSDDFYPDDDDGNKRREDDHNHEEKNISQLFYYEDDQRFFNDLIIGDHDDLKEEINNKTVIIVDGKIVFNKEITIHGRNYKGELIYQYKGPNSDIIWYGCEDAIWEDLRIAYFDYQFMKKKKPSYMELKRQQHEFECEVKFITPALIKDETC